MDDPSSIISNIILVFILVAVNGFFVAAEFAMVRARQIRIQTPEFQKKFGASAALALVSDLDNSLSATQLGITITSLVLGWWGEQTFHGMFASLFGNMHSDFLSHGLSIFLSMAIITYLHVVLGELVAKSVAIRFPETLLRILAPLTLLFCKICRPAMLILNGSASLILRTFGISAAPSHDTVHSSSELHMIISESTRSGVLDKDEEQMIKGMLVFSETVAREIMTPRTEMVTIAEDAALTTVAGIVLKSGFSRIPVVGESVDHVLGVVLVKDVLIALGDSNREHLNLKSIMRDILFVPGTKRIDELLREFKKKKIHIAIVLDEHGGVDGLVTLEDVIEEIFGDIFDESDEPLKEIIQRPGGEVIIDGGVLVADLNHRLGIHLPEGEYDTIAGLFYSFLGRVPTLDDELVFYSDGEVVPLSAAEKAEHIDTEADADDRVVIARMSVLKVIGHRIETVRLLQSAKA
ncbi:HlyC/CorC family transporter [bacterium]|nr:HlyC/CorC family transporter [bacterium]